MKRVLIITYYWPPAGGPGVQRWLKFVKYFRSFEIEPIVFIPENPHYPILDESLISEVPTGVEIIRQPIKEPYKYAKIFSEKKTKKISSGIIEEKKPSILEKLLLYVRGNLFIPDARVGWVKPSVKYLESYLKTNKDVDTVITTGPPHSLHLIGSSLKEKLNIKWIADFRDPWTTIHYHKSLRLSKKAQNKHKELEKKVLNTADQIVVTSPTTQKDFQKITSQPIKVITNGYDTEEVKAVSLDAKFSIVHIGSLLSNRNPEILWKSLSELKNEDSEFSKDLELKLVGIVAEETKDRIEAYQLSENLVTPGYVSHNDAIAFQNSAQVLLLVEMNKEETNAIIPGKLFEYMNSKRPIIAIGPDKSDVEDILKDSNSGAYFNYDNLQELKTTIKEKYNSYKSGNLSTNNANIEQYGRKALTQKMASLIKDL